MKIILLAVVLLISRKTSSQPISDTTSIENIAKSIKNDKFSMGYSVKSLPKFIKKGIKKIEGRSFTAADRGKEFNETDVITNSSLPFKRILYIAYSDSIYIITYEQGGYSVSCKTKLIQYKNKKIEHIVNLDLPKHKDLDELLFLLNDRKHVRFSRP